MNYTKYLPVIEVVAISFLVYLAHKILFLFNDNNPKIMGFQYPLETIYGFFFICSVVIVFILIKVKEKNIDNVGYTFLIVTCIKMAVSYTLLYPILQSGIPNMRVEKINFFVVFALFLSIETVVTIRILNSKQ